MTQEVGFVAIPNALIRDRALTPNTKIVYGVILSYAFGANWCTASTETLCADAGVSRAGFFNALAILREHHLVDVRKVKGRVGWRNVYRPTMRGGLVISDEDHGGVVQDLDDPGVVHEVDGGSSTRWTQKKTKTEEHLIPESSRLKESTREPKTRTFRNRGGA